jgi:ribosomal protein L37AE/L43A
MVDKRPDPKPRKNSELWQAYLWWDEIMRMRQRHTLRLSSIDAGKSNLDGGTEEEFIGVIEPLLKEAEKSLAAWGKTTGPIWDWLVGIKGIGKHTAAKLLAQYDDVGKFDTVSKFWTFAGYGLRDGQIMRCVKGEKAPYNRRLKSELYLVAENFVRHQTPVYVDLYYAEKERQRRLHPEPVCRECGGVGEQKGQSWRCSECKAPGGKLSFTPAHIDSRAKRKVAKIFLSHLWVKWREYEDLPVTLPYAFAVMEHSPEHYVEPV